MTTRFGVLREAIDADPERRARVEALTQRMTAVLATLEGEGSDDLAPWLAWLRDDCGLTYEDVVRLYVDELRISTAIISAHELNGREVRR